MHLFKKLLIAGVCAAVLFGAGTGLWVWQGVGSLSKPVVMAEPMLFDVPEGTAFNGVARQLEADGLIKKDLWVRVYGRLFPDRAKIKAGVYEFTDGMSAEAMLDKMVAGDTKHWSVQFIEGWTFSDMRTALNSNQRIEHLTADWSDEKVMEAVGAKGEHPEGRFFPDTYLFTSSESDIDMLRRAFQRMKTVLADEWENKEEGLPYDNAYEALIMASIVERETGAPQERGQVAGVFVRRLQKGMRLQTDPTVIYGMGDKYNGRIGRRDLRAQTPYNTYRINGLPPTPIALPGREAIHASLHPDSGKSLYFVARGDGTHKFSNTLAEHQKAVRAFQLNRRADYRSSPAGEGDEQ
ncbi:MAG TPA: endolytic transglycosylase MltG [Marinobacter sp.]|uniref:Endolytic murein transglycosylase n=1 Tax=Marinobacter antarcticus TaxID=564117 RepID=A0A831R4L3_9GAMM|nr:endolytic transglycosylase MltG [Marinobacter sp.]HEA52782.1 endolytic transglycosylase MltG [Marinobacter antarcticus]